MHPDCPFVFAPQAATSSPSPTDTAETSSALNERLNRLRAGVLGANDGIVSTAAVVVGVAAAGSSTAIIATAGAAAVLGGAVSMALGEYVSVSSQRDTERALVAEETRDLLEEPDAEFRELVQVYRDRGLSPRTAHAVATELTRGDALAAHLDVHWGISREEFVSPWAAALASFISFILGAVMPLLTIIFGPEPVRIALTCAVTLCALAATGWIAARLGKAPAGRAAVRVTVGGALALGATYTLGLVFS
ncbi:VIT1/CCC1 transporter family protein [Corynebacterium atypicum]|uniref:VIT1/CCC1 transporter family protein n=1 Tax=Corynebacterium atypicum TaxID=191610 RepID=UPI000A029353